VFRPILQLLAALALILGGSSQALRAPVQPPVCACPCGCPETDASTCPCGMPKAPQAPAAPDLALAQPAAVPASQVKLAQAGQRRLEPRPCPANELAAAPEALGFQAKLGHGPARFAPPGRTLDRLAEWSLLRI
jgi:hypothetical protein